MHAKKNVALMLFFVLAACAARGQTVGDAVYLRGRISAVHSIACESVPENDQPGRKAQEAAREALAYYAKALIYLRQQQALATQRFTAEQMDSDEKEARIESLAKQIEELQRLTHTDTACPLPSLLSSPQSKKNGAFEPTIEPLLPPRVGPNTKDDPVSASRQGTPGALVANPDANADQQAATTQQQESKPRVNQTIASGPKLRVFPTELTFRPQPWQTQSEPQTITITNQTSDRVDLVPPVSPSADFRTITSTCTNTLGPFDACNFQIAYVPFGPRTPRSFVAALATTDQATFTKLADDLASKQHAVEETIKTTHEAEEDLERTREAADRAKKNAAKFHTLEQDLNKAEETVRIRNADLERKKTTAKGAWEALRGTVPVVALSGTPEHWKYPFLRSVAGLDVSAVTSRTVQQKFFIEADLLAPIHMLGLRKWKNEEPLENRWWFWVNPRITSLPQATNFSALSTINESGTFFQNLRTQGTTADIAQGLDASAGLEYVLLKPRSGIPWWDEFPNTKARLSSSFIVGLGVSTPFSTDRTDVTSKVNQSICDAYNNAQTKLFTCQSPKMPTRAMSPIIQVNGTEKQFITFVTPDRSRFFRRYFAGFRLKSYYFSPDVKADCYPPTDRPKERGDCEAPYNVFPGIMDLTIGQDEAVTSGFLRGLIFRAEASYPISFFPGLHLYTSVYTLLRKNRPSPPFSAFTVQPPDAGSNNDSNAFRFPVPPLSRDYFRVGVGVDLVQILKKFEKGGQPTTHAPAPPADRDQATVAK